MKLQDFPCGQNKALKPLGSWPAAGHYYEPDHVKAVVAAWHAGRPLLVRGEPGVGKSQLASAMAQALRWQFISVGVQPRTEYQDLLWEFDAVARLAHAQMLGSLERITISDMEKLPASLHRERFIIPGPLWWAVRPESAEGQLKETDRKSTPYLVAEPENEGLVLLIDEIDKADANLPNGLLELLGNGDIGLPLGSVRPEPLRRPLTIITSNDERQLPPAFMRRCLILTMALPRPGESLINHLITFAAAHVEGKQDDVSKVPEAVIRKAAELVNELREKASEGERPPGPAEFLDLLRVVGGLGGTQKDMESQIDDLYRIVLIKEVAEAD